MPGSPGYIMAQVMQRVARLNMGQGCSNSRPSTTGPKFIPAYVQAKPPVCSGIFLPSDVEYPPSEISACNPKRQNQYQPGHALGTLLEHARPDQAKTRNQRGRNEHQANRYPDWHQYQIVEQAQDRNEIGDQVNRAERIKRNRPGHQFCKYRRPPTPGRHPKRE